MIEKLQAFTRKILATTGNPIPPNHPIWTAGGWKRFLGSPDAVRGAIRYIEANPTKIGLPRQSWPFVKNYDGWPFHRLASNRKS